MAVGKDNQGTYGKNQRGGDMAAALAAVARRTSSPPPAVPVARTAGGNITSLVMVP